MSDNTNNQSDLSKAVDKALLNLSRDHGISLPKDDYVLVQVYLNKSIVEQSFDDAISKLNLENKASKDYFRKALIQLTKIQNEKMESLNEKIERTEKSFNLSSKKIFIAISAMTFINLVITILNYLGV